MNEEKKRNLSWIFALIISLGLIASTLVGTYGYIKSKAPRATITVTGSAKKQIKSDLVVWKGNFNEQSKDISGAYNDLKVDLGKVKKYLNESGIEDNDMTISPVNTNVNYIMGPYGVATSTVDSYKLSQEIEIKSNDIDKITKISRESTKLISEGVKFQSVPPQYFYTKIADLKVDMLAAATKDAKNRAEQIASNSGTSIGKLFTAKMGVFQITPLNSNEVTDYGINDTTSVDKEIMSVVNCVFETK